MAVKGALMMSLKIAGFLICIAYLLGQDSSPDALQSYREGFKRNPADSLLHFRLGELLFEHRDYQSSANEFRAALKGAPHPNWIDVWSLIDLGEIFDVSGQRSRAVQEYQAALRTRDDTDGAQAFAAKRLKGGQDGSLVLHHVSYENLSDSVRKPAVNIPAHYSVEGRVAGLEGTVFLVGSVASDASATNFQVVQPLGLGLDDAAIQAARSWIFESEKTDAVSANQVTTVRAEFLLPANESRWHLLRVVFAIPDGVSRPHFLSAPYPGGDGISPSARDSANLLKLMGRQAVVTLAFEVDEAGRPELIRNQDASEPIWGGEAASFVRRWRFAPAKKDGMPVRVPCTIDLVWGEKQFTPKSLEVAAATFRALGETAER
jgi:outer membrane biosynthesis protein TonB